MKKPDAKLIKPAYAFTREIETEIVLACTRDQIFVSAIGHVLDPERIADPVGSKIIDAVRTLKKKHGRSPASAAVVIQHFEYLLSRGSVKPELVIAVKEYLIDAATNSTVGREDLVAVAVPVVRRVMYQEAAQGAHAAFGHDTDPGEVAKAFGALSTLGQVKPEPETLSTNSFIEDRFFAAKDKSDYLPLGIPELDEALDGGMERRALGLLVGATGAGKSMALSHIAVNSAVRGLGVYYATLEISAENTARRMHRNMIDMTRREIELDVALAQKRTQLALATYAGIVVDYLEPIVTTPSDIRDMIHKHADERRGLWKPEVIVIDFMDKVRVDRKAKLYDDMLVVADQLRGIGGELDGWTWTASQADRKSTGRAWLDLDAVADSMNKVRSADIVVAVGRTEEDAAAGEIRFTVPKRREGEGVNSRIGPIPWDPERGRICVVNDRQYPW